MNNQGSIPEKLIKNIMGNYILAQGWRSQPDELLNRNTDIEAVREDKRWVIEIRSTCTITQEITNAFVSGLGKILQRMDDKNCKYSIALPDMKPFRRLWERLPALAKQRTGITALFISKTGEVEEIPGEISAD